MLLAMKLHWSRDSIMKLQRAEFDFYVAEVIKFSEPGDK
jgi:hypothetical protein